MSNFKNIIGHEQIIQHMSTALKIKKYPMPIFLKVRTAAERICWQRLLRRHWNVRLGMEIPAICVAPAIRWIQVTSRM